MAAKSRSEIKSSVAKKSSTRRSSSKGLMLIAIFKLFKGVVFLAVALGARHLLSQDLSADVEHWIDLLRIDPHNHYIHILLTKIAKMDPKRIRELRAGTFFYAILFLIEGTGLALRQRWAEYVTIISTSSLVPIEVYELLKQYTPLKVAFLLINVMVVVYLVWELRRSRTARG